MQIIFRKIIRNWIALRDVISSNESGKYFVNFINPKNKRKRDDYELGNIEDVAVELEEQTISVTAQDVTSVNRNSHRGCSLTRGVFKSFAEYLNNILFLKRDSGRGVFLWILRNF